MIRSLSKYLVAYRRKDEKEDVRRAIGEERMLEEERKEKVRP